MIIRNPNITEQGFSVLTEAISQLTQTTCLEINFSW